ncbi:hypothetical protein DSS3PM1_00042 [Bacteriophage DSS3_PM1]|nr:hypothetical protein DSS3PM1_00042 [Bacteriophage DSS3_PM1]
MPTSAGDAVIAYRVESLEKQLEELSKTQIELREAVHALNTNTTLMNQSLSIIAASVEKKDTHWTKVYLLAAAVVISQAINWIFDGGMGTPPPGAG